MIRRGVALLLALSSLAAGCVAGPAPEIETAVSLPQSFAFTPAERTASSMEALLPVSDPAFRTLTGIAQSNAPSLAEALARVEGARANVRGAGAARGPQVSLDRTISANRINPNQFSDTIAGFVDTEQVSFGTNVIASWDPDLFGVLKSAQRAAISRAEAAEANARAVELALIAEIAVSVIDWNTLTAREAALREDLAAAQRLAQLAGTRERAGLAPGFDRLRAEAAASSSQTRLDLLGSERAVIIGRLITLTGASGQSVQAAFALEAPERAVPDPVAALPSQLLENRPDVLAAAAQLAASDAQLAAAARQRFPRLTLSAALGLLSFDLGGLVDEDAVVGSASAALLGPIFDFGRIQSEIDAAAADKRAAFAAYRGAVFTALGDAETAYALVAASDRELSAAWNETSQLERTAQLADTRYRAGLSDFLTVLEARRTADASGERAAASEGRVMRARVLLWQALGGSTLDYRPADGTVQPSP